MKGLAVWRLFAMIETEMHERRTIVAFVERRIKNNFLITILVVNFQILNLRDEGPTPGWDDPAVLARPGPRARPGRFAAAVNDGAARRRLRPCPLAQL